MDLLERYADWLRGGGASEEVIRTIYIPMAGHWLGLALKPHPELDLQADLQPALEYVRAKGAGPDWADVCRCSLDKFRRFLLHTRGLVEADYFAAMSRIELRLELAPENEPHSQPFQEGEREHLLALTEQLAEPELSLESRLEIVFQIRGLLGEPVLVQEDQVGILGAVEWIPPPASVLANSETA